MSSAMPRFSALVAVGEGEVGREQLPLDKEEEVVVEEVVVV